MHIKYKKNSNYMITPESPWKTLRISCSVTGWLVASGLDLDAGVRMELM